MRIGMELSFFRAGLVFGAGGVFELDHGFHGSPAARAGHDQGVLPRTDPGFTAPAAWRIGLSAFGARGYGRSRTELRC